MPKTNVGEMTSRRFQNIHSNATVATAIKKIATEFGLPEESVQLVRPGGRKANQNKTIRALRAELGSCLMPQFARVAAQKSKAAS